MNDLRLTPSQQKVWQSRFAELPRGTQTQIAGAIAGAHGNVRAWCTRVCNFFKGQEGALKSIFPYPKYLKVVAHHVHCTTGDLEEWFAAARGVPHADRALDTRIPGFEDLGAIPILDAFYPPPHRETQYHLIGRPSSSGGGLSNVDQMFEAVRSPSLRIPPIVITRSTAS